MGNFTGSGQFEGWPTGGSSGINPDTSTSGYPSKVDHGMNLAGNQRVRQLVVPYVPHLPRDPAGGAPTHDNAFEAGHRWTEAEGKVQSESGNGAV